MRNLTIPLTDDQYAFFEQKRAEYNVPYISHAFKKFFLIESDEESFSLSIGAHDKKWVGLITMIYDLMAQAEAEVTRLSNNGAKTGYFELLNYVKNVRVMSDMVVSQFDKHNLAIDPEQFGHLSDISILIAQVIENCVGNPRKIDKLRLALAKFIVRGE